MLVLKSILRNMVRVGTLTVIDAKGTKYVFSGINGPEVTVRLNDHKIPWGLVFTPSLAAGEGYMDGRLTVEEGTIYDFLALIAQNMEIGGLNQVQKIWEIVGRLFKRFHQFNPANRAKKMLRIIMTYQTTFMIYFSIRTNNIHAPTLYHRKQIWKPRKNTRNVTWPLSCSFHQGNAS